MTNLREFPSESQKLASGAPRPEGEAAITSEEAITNIRWIKSLKPGQKVAVRLEGTVYPQMALVDQVYEGMPKLGGNWAPPGVGPDGMPIAPPMPDFKDHKPPFVQVGGGLFFDRFLKPVPVGGQAPVATLHAWNERLQDVRDRREMLGRLKEIDWSLLSTDSLHKITETVFDDLGIS